MIRGVTSGTVPSIGVAAITAMRYTRSDGYSVVVPVRPAQAINASFRHIQALPDSRLQDGIPLYKLKILDTLIDQLARDGASRSSGGVASAYRAGFLPLPGAFVDLVA